MPAKKKADDSFRVFVLDQLAGLGGVEARSMFGGCGLYCRGVFFGILYAGRLYFKTNETTEAQYREWGMKPFKPSPKQIMKNYHEVPADLLEEAPRLVELAEESIRIAVKKK